MATPEIRIEIDSAHPTIRRAARESRMRCRRCPSACDHTLCRPIQGPGAVNSRLTRSGRRSGPLGLRVVAGAPPLPLPDTPAKYIRRAVCSRPMPMPLTSRHTPHCGSTIDTLVCSVNLMKVFHEGSVTKIAGHSCHVLCVGDTRGKWGKSHPSNKRLATIRTIFSKRIPPKLKLLKHHQSTFRTIHAVH